MSCWGANGFGQLGNGTATPSTSPVPVFNVTTATGIVAGRDHGCAHLSTGTVRCWGINNFGELGDGTMDQSSIPVAVLNSDRSMLTGVTAVAAGVGHSCARLTDGTVSCWGNNTVGQLGNGGILVSPLPVKVIGIP